jgi:FkbM family methyltransferase
MKSHVLSQVKQHIRLWLVALNWPLTRNLKYDILTKKILARELNTHSNCIDVGAHKGEILDLFLQIAPQGKHVAFEPIPSMVNVLQASHGNRVTIYPYALGSCTGKALFNHVVSDPAYSGLQQRSYKQANPVIEHIEVEVRKLDDILANRSTKIDLIKIDVEGGELDVLRGALSLIAGDNPVLIFEFGKGASEYYGTMPHHMMDLLQSINYAMWTLGGFWKKKDPLTTAELEKIYTSGSDYYFVAAPHTL